MKPKTPKTQEKQVAQTPHPEHLQQELENKTKQLEDYTATLKLLQADFENYIKRSEKEKQELTTYSTGKLLLRLLTIIDDFERALHLGKETDKETLLQGLDMIHKEAHKLLTEQGVTPIPAVGTKFDPYKHDIIDFKETEHEEGTIIEEYQKGYFLKDKVLRPSKVRVSKGASNVQQPQH